MFFYPYHKGFLCSTSANVYGIDFLAFLVQNYNSKEIIFQFGNENGIEDASSQSKNPSREMECKQEQPMDDNLGSTTTSSNISFGGTTTSTTASSSNTTRTIDYTLPEEILRAPVLLTRLTFRCQKALRNFRIIERHYFVSRLIKSYDFTFNFCIPGSVNSWETLYEIPPLTDECIADMIANPFQATSDTFYFVDNTLVMHNKARYRYIPKGMIPAVS